MKKLILLVLAACYSTIMLAQSVVTGTVTSSDDGLPLPFATIQVKGTTTGEYTNDSGKYSIKVPANGVLIFSTIGFITQEIPVAGKSVIDVQLKPDAIALEETIVVAYGTAKKGSFTGSASTVRAAAINDIPAASFENALVGTVAGLQMTPGSGQVGSAVNIRVRGTGSMNASSEPLYVIDGVPTISGEVSNLNYSSNNVMNSINPNDIASITVLKDAAASSLYGSRAANGVVLITTKSGKTGKMSVNFKATYGFTPSFAVKGLEKASPEDQVAYSKDLYYAWAVNNKEPNPTEKAEKDYKNYIGDDPRGYFDWEDALFRTAGYQSYDISINGGSEKTQYFASAGYTKETGRSTQNDLSRWNGRLNINQQIIKGVELSSNISYSSVEKSGFNDTYNNGANYFLMARNLLFGNWWPYKENGEPVTTPWRTYAQNVLYYDQFRENVSNINKLSVNEALSIRFTKDLTFKTVFSYDETRVDDYSWRAATHYEGVSTKGNVTNNNTKIVTMVTSNTLNYNKTFKEKHNLNALLGYEAEKNKTDYLHAEGTNLPTLGAKTIATAGKSISNGYYYGNNMMSVFARVEYNYDNKYYVSGSIREDGSSKLSREARWGNFWSVSGSWRINSENFLKDVNWLSNLRLKASYGVNGTLPTDSYGHLALYSFGYNYNTNPGGKIATVADMNLSWETSYTYNIGLEAGFLDSRLTLGAEYYNRESKNLLQDVPISKITGFSTILTNFGAMNNSGIEIELGGEIIRGKNWNWKVSVNASTLRSRVTKLYEGSDIIWNDPTGGDAQARFIYREGCSPKSFYLREWAGVDPENGEPMWFTNNDKTKPYKTIDGRPVTNKWAGASDVIAGCADPKLFGGISTNLSWKGISLDLNFTYSLGGDAFNTWERYVNDDGYFTSRTRSKKAMDYWKKPGDVTQAPKLGIGSGEQFNKNNTRYLYKNNYLRLKTINLSYNFPKELISKIKLNNLRVYFTGLNLLTFASQKDFDPEVSVYGVSSWHMPIGKTFTFGIDIGI